MTDPFFSDKPKQKPETDIGDIEKDSKEISEELPYDDEISSEDKKMASIMAYIPFLCFVPLLNVSSSKDVRFHARQGVILFIIELVAALFLIDQISDFFFKVILIFAVALSVAGLVFAAQGKNYKLPIIGDLIDKSKL
jgi:uncharacterized membrane protein